MNSTQPSPALEAFWSYTRAFQALDPKATAAHFHQPALMVTPQGVQALPDTAAVERVYARVMAELPAQHYARTEFSQIDERRLSADLALLSGSGTWIDTDGRAGMRFGMTYTLRRTGEDWRIVVAIIHSPAAN